MTLLSDFEELHLWRRLQEILPDHPEVQVRLEGTECQVWYKGAPKLAATDINHAILYISNERYFE